MIIVFEGLDGSGKGTQSQKLSARMSANGIENSLYSFPNYKGTSFGLEVGKYLNGGFGNLNDIPPQFPVMLYAMDRFEMKKSIMADIAAGHNIIFDRYVPSNIAHQGVKLQESERAAFSDWVKRLEYNILEMPQPDVIVFLDAEPQIASANVLKKKKRDYTDADKDMHESNDDYLVKVYEYYKRIALKEGWITVPCSDGENMRGEDDIARDIQVSIARAGFPIR